MAKVERDPRDEGPPPARTVEEDVPPLHVLEAEQAQERKETDDLLAGFDKPGRAPRRRRGEEDFVAYYAKEPGAPTAEVAFPAPEKPGPAFVERADSSRERPTRILLPKSRLPTWAPIALVGIAISIVIVIVTFVATREQAPARAPATPTASIVPTAAPTTPSSDVPPPDPIATATASAAPAAPPSASGIPATPGILAWPPTSRPRFTPVKKDIPRVLE